jgi:transposase-like protein
MNNKTAIKGQVFVCSACGRRSRDLYGEQAINCTWDESCMLHAVLCYENSISVKNNLVVYAEAVKENNNAQ